MKLKLDRIISIATLAAMVAIFLVLRKPTPVVVQVPATTAAPAQSSGQPMEQREQAAQQVLRPPAEAMRQLRCRLRRHLRISRPSLPVLSRKPSLTSVLTESAPCWRKLHNPREAADFRPTRTLAMESPTSKISK